VCIKEINCLSAVQNSLTSNSGKASRQSLVKTDAGRSFLVSVT